MIWRGGPIALNGLSALASALAAVFVVGGRHALIQVLHPELVGSCDHQFAYLLDRREPEDFVRRGYRIACTEEVRRANLLFCDVDLAEFGAVVFGENP